MPVCKKIRGQKRQVCIGAKEDLITLQDRSITAPSFGVDATETFTDSNPDVWAMVKTVRGETMFDNTGTERDVTHKFYIEFLTGVTAETWLTFNGDRFDILDVEDLDERHQDLLLRASNRGVLANAANQA